MDRNYRVTFPEQYLGKPMYNRLGFTGEKTSNATGSQPFSITNIPDKDSDSSQWMQWHKELKSRYGKKTANSLWMLAWKRFGSTSIFGSSSADLRAYMKSNGVMLDKNALASLEDTGLSIVDSIGDIFSIGKYAGIAVLIIIIGGAGMIIYNIAKNPAKSAGVALKYAK